MNTVESGTPSLRDILTDAFRYWERRRLYYNLVLTLVVAGVMLLAWPASSSLLGFQGLLLCFVLAVIANVCYSTAYLVDVPLQYSGYRVVWQKWRFLLWMLGTLFAAALAYYWMVDEVLVSAL